MARVETYSLSKTPYIEGGFAIANIFRLVRDQDFIKRLYLSEPSGHPDLGHPGADKVRFLDVHLKNLLPF